MWAVSPGHCRTCPEFPWHRVPAMLLDRRGPLLIGFVLQVVEFVLAIVAHLYALLVAVRTNVVALVLAAYVNRWQGSRIN